MPAAKHLKTLLKGDESVTVRKAGDLLRASTDPATGKPWEGSNKLVQDAVRYLKTDDLENLTESNAEGVEALTEELGAVRV